MKVGIAMPWRPQPGREDAHTFCVDWWERTLPDAKLYEVDTAHEVYNLAAARNLGVQVAEADGCDVVVVADADTVYTPSRHVVEAVAQAATDERVHMPFTDQRYLTEQETRKIILERVLPPLQGHRGNGCCYIMTPATYWAFGGSDERFSGWGGDDDQLVAAATCLVGLRRHRAIALSLWHPASRDVGSERHKPNAALAHRYWDAVHSRQAMRELIAEQDYE